MNGTESGAPKQSLERTAGRPEASRYIMKTRPLQFAPALASGGWPYFRR
jgi:hypothetical protein